MTEVTCFIKIFYRNTSLLTNCVSLHHTILWALLHSYNSISRRNLFIKNSYIVSFAIRYALSQKVSLFFVLVFPMKRLSNESSVMYMLPNYLPLTHLDMHWLLRHVNQPYTPMVILVSTWIVVIKSWHLLNIVNWYLTHEYIDSIIRTIRICVFLS